MTSWNFSRPPDDRDLIMCCIDVDSGELFLTVGKVFYYESSANGVLFEAHAEVPGDEVCAYPVVAWMDAPELPEHIPQLEARAVEA